MMSFPIRVLPVGVLCLVSLAGDLPGQGGRESEIVGIERFRGSRAARELLLAQGFVVDASGSWVHGEREQPLRQVFSAYVGAPLPPFVTVDLLLDAYTAQLARVVLGTERRQAATLLQFSRRLVDVAGRLDHPRGVDVALLAGAALALQRGEADGAAADVRRVLTRIRRSDRPLPGLPAARAAELEPSGRYAADPDLAGYFRARRLYELCWPEDDRSGRELATAIARCRADPGVQALVARLRAPFEELLGPSIEGPLLGGQWTPMFTLCNRSDAEHVPHRATTGLAMLAMGPLCSPAGRRIFAASGRDAGSADGVVAVDAPDTHFGRLLGVLRRLQEPDPRAPGLFRTPAWQDLQASSQLGAWAQARHAFGVQGQVYVTRGVGGDEPVGRVAPYPAAFEGLARAAASLRAFWRRTALVGSALEAQDALRRGIGYYDVMLAPKGRRLTPEQARTGEAVYRIVEALVRGELGERPAGDIVMERARAATGAPPGELAAEARDLLDGFRLGWTGVHLARLELLAGRLAAISEHQLRGARLAVEERQLLQQIGGLVGSLHDYVDGSWAHPRDDHARLSPIAHIDGHGLLQVGVARPEPLYVILEDGGRPTLYCGAVLSYRETLGGAVCGDAEWRERVAGGRAPAPPAFTRSFRR